MTMLAPMTFIVTLVLILSVVIGVLVLLKALGASKTRQDEALGTRSPCAHCGKHNPTHARFCGHCGKPLN